MPFLHRRLAEDQGLSEAASILDEAISKRGTGKVMVSPERAEQLKCLIEAQLAPQHT
jgi:hypothetical protein